jgi:hypothetical protein
VEHGKVAALPASSQLRSVPLPISDEPDELCLSRFLLGMDRWGELQVVTERARAADDELTAEGVRARFLRAIVVRVNSSCLFLYEAGSPETVGDAGRRTQLAVGRIDESMRIANDQGVTP